MTYLTAQYKKSLTSLKGFSLIELLVVISIIAILSVIGITVFSGAQRSARDAQRRTDVNNIVKAVETKKLPSVATYGGLAVGATDFSNGSIPSDPVTTKIYCATPTGTATTATAAPTTDWVGTCPSGYVTVNGTAYTVPANATQVRVCAWLEQDNVAFCRNTAQ